MICRQASFFFFFFFNDTATTEIYTLSLHDALPISPMPSAARMAGGRDACVIRPGCSMRLSTRSEEHTSELQSRSDLVCRLLLEKKKKTNTNTCHYSSASTRQDPHAQADER